MDTNKPLSETLEIVEPVANSETDYHAYFQSQSPEWRQAEQRKLLRKIDLRLLPILILCYLLNFLDRSNLAQARQGSLEKDLGMTGSDFNLATSIFFVGYLIMQLPSNMILTRVRPSLYLGCACVLWGVVSTCNAATHTFISLVLTRFFLGFVEAPFFPGAIFLMSSWYTREELTRRIPWFYSGNALANMFGGVIAAAILGNMDGASGIAGWRWLFIIEGVFTIFVGFLAALLLPDYPHTTRWLNDNEKALAVWRLLEDINESDEQHASTIWVGLKLAVKDYRLYIFVLFQHIALLTQTFQYFFPSIVQTLGYDHITTLWLTVPAWAVTFCTTFFVTWSSARTKDRSIHIMVLMVIGAVGNAIATGTTSTGARFFAMFLMPIGTISSYAITVVWIANSFPRPLVKRSASIAICNMIGNTSSIYGAYMYPSSDAPRFIPGGSANAVVCLIVAALAYILRVLHLRENRKLEAAEQEDQPNVDKDGSKTDGDKRTAGFRYIT